MSGTKNRESEYKGAEIRVPKQDDTSESAITQGHVLNIVTKAYDIRSLSNTLFDDYPETHVDAEVTNLNKWAHETYESVNRIIMEAPMLESELF